MRGIKQLAIMGWIGEGGADPRFKLLTPDPDLDDHSEYVDWLDQAVDCDQDIRNIALSGGYGSGKSSILANFAKQREKNIVWISFATLGGHPTKVSADAQAKMIQKEIVKQLLFKEAPSKIPHSKYRRVARPSRFKTLVLASVITLILAGLFYGLTLRLVTTIGLSGPTGLAGLVATAIFILAAGLITWAIWHFSGKINIDKINGGKVELSLSATQSYFDEYLDEIIYFFQATRYDIVIFEDIDRFENLLIFEQLRQLNTLLNNSRQIRRPIRFIYAVKDSIFTIDTMSQGQQIPLSLPNKSIYGASESRTKFFDLIIPIVPFITYENSASHIAKMFPDVGADVIKLVSRHVTDMRLIHNIRNEYVLFSQKLQIGTENQLLLEPDKLFAMMVYKNLYLHDYEELKNTGSDLEKIYTYHREHVRTGIVANQGIINDTNAQLNNAIQLDQKIARYGNALRTYIELQRTNKKGATLGQILDAKGQVIDLEALDTQQFWQEAQQQTNVVLTINWTVTGYGVVVTDTITRAQLEVILGEIIDIHTYTTEQRQELEANAARATTLIDELRHASIKKHLGLSEGFKQQVREVLKDKPLAYSLITAGYIDDFHLQYYSTYNGMMSPRALRFKHYNIQNNVMDIDYQLTSTDIRRIVEDTDMTYFSDQSMYNIALVDHLLRNRGPQLQAIISSLGTGTDEARQFISAYLRSHKKHTFALVRQLSPRFSGLINLIISDSTDARYTMQLLDEAMSHTSTEHPQALQDTDKQFILRHISRLPSITATGVATDRVGAAMNVIEQAGTLGNLGKLSPEAKTIAIARHAYDINSENLDIAVDGANPALNQLRSNPDHKAVYDYMLASAGNLDAYLRAIKGNRRPKKYAIIGEQEFVSLINDISQPDMLDQVLEQSDLTGISKHPILDILTIDVDIRPAALKWRLIDKSLGNVLMYYAPPLNEGEEGERTRELDATLASYLNDIDGDIHLEKPYDDYEARIRNSFVKDVMNNQAVTSQAKAHIMRHMYVERGKGLKIDYFDKQEGDLYGVLLENQVLFDTAENYAHIQTQSWPTRQSYIEHSTKFLDLVRGGEIVLDQTELNGIAQSNALAPTLKQHLLDSYSSYADKFTPESIRSLLEYAVKNNVALTFPTLIALISHDPGQVSNDTIVTLYNASSESLTRDQVRELFTHGSGEYRKIATSRLRPLLPETEATRNLAAKLVASGVIRQPGRIERDKRRLSIL